MLNCKQATQLMSDSMEAPLSFGKRIALIIHLMMCKYCSRALKQFKFLRSAAGKFDLNVDNIHSNETLSDNARERIKENLKKL